MKLSKKIWVVVGGAWVFRDDHPGLSLASGGTGATTMAVSAHSTQKAAIEAAMSENEHALSYEGAHQVVALEVDGDFELVTVEYFQV